jgi:inosine-uridine nucleoside N-ribohydrolase
LDPETKAKIASLIMSELQIEVPIHSGFGISPSKENMKEFLQQNPCLNKRFIKSKGWPLDKFGSPNPKEGEKEIYSKQGEAYKEVYENFDKIKISKNTAVEAILLTSLEVFKNTGNKLNIVCLAPPFNIYEALKLDSTLSERINLIMMGGWFEKDGIPIRLGYNHAINPIIMEFIFKTVCSILIVSSQFVKDGKFVMKDEEFKMLEEVKNKSKLCKSILKDWRNWLKEDYFFFEKVLADPLTLYVAIHQDIVQSVPVEIKINGIKDGLIVDEFKQINMLSEDANRFLSVDYKVEKSNIHIVSSLKNPNSIRKSIINCILGELTIQNKIKF